MAFLTQRLRERASCVEVETTLKVPVGLPTRHEVALHGNVVRVVQTAQIVQPVHIVLPVDADVERFPSVLTNPLKAALQKGSFEGSLRRKQSPERWNCQLTW